MAIVKESPDFRSLAQLTPFTLLENVNSIDELIEIGQQIGDTYKHRDSDINGVTSIETKTVSGSGLDGFSSKGLKLHTDSSAAYEPPRFILFRCEKQARSGGWTRILNAQALLTNLLKDQNAELLDALTHTEACELKSGTETYKGPVLNFNNKGPLIRLRQDGQAIFSKTLNGLKNELNEIFSSHTHKFRLEAGQAYIADNWTMLHGRSSFKGDRKCQRILIRN